MNLMFCSPGVLCSSELRFDFFAFAQKCLTKKLEENTIDPYSSYGLLFGFYTRKNVTSAAYFVFTWKIDLPYTFQVLRWVLFVRQIFDFPHSEFEQNTYSSDPRPDTVSLMQLESRSAVPQASQPPSKASARTSNSTTRRTRREKSLQTSGSRSFFSVFFCFVFRQQIAVCGSAALLLRIKALALNRSLFVLFALVGRTATTLDGNYLKPKFKP